MKSMTNSIIKSIFNETIEESKLYIIFLFQGANIVGFKQIDNGLL